MLSQKLEIAWKSFRLMNAVWRILWIDKCCWPFYFCVLNLLALCGLYSMILFTVLRTKWFSSHTREVVKLLDWWFLDLFICYWIYCFNRSMFVNYIFNGTSFLEINLSNNILSMCDTCHCWNMKVWLNFVTEVMKSQNPLNLLVFLVQIVMENRFLYYRYAVRFSLCQLGTQVIEFGVPNSILLYSSNYVTDKLCQVKVPTTCYCCIMKRSLFKPKGDFFHNAYFMYFSTFTLTYLEIHLGCLQCNSCSEV